MNPGPAEPEADMLPSEPTRQGYVCISVNYIIPNQLAQFPLCIERVYKSKLHNA